jgi:hypothetical protein
MKKRFRPETTRTENCRRKAPATDRQLECVTGGARSHIVWVVDPLDPDQEP